MQPFKISDVQELFERDLDQFYNVTRSHLTRLLCEPSPPPELLEDAKRQAHSLKGLAATVHAWALSYWGADLERLLQLAESVLWADRDRANAIFKFIQDHLEDWYVMNQLSLLDNLQEAWDHYLGLRKLMEEAWQGYLPEINPAALGEPHAEPEASTASQPENSEPPGNEIPAADEKSVEEAFPLAPHDLHAARPQPLDLISPTLRRLDQPAAEMAEEIRASVDAQSPIPELHPARPAPLDLISPALQRLHDTSASTDETVAPALADAVPAAPIEVEISESSLPTLLPAQPKPLDLKLPALRRLDESASDISKAATPISSERSAAHGLIPARPKPLDLLPPKLLKKGMPETESSAETLCAADTTHPLVSQSEAIPAVPVQPPSAIPAIAPLIVEVTPPILKRLGKKQTVAPAQAAMPSAGAESAPAETAGSGDQSEFLEMLSQEVEGYLEELSTNLLSLAANLDDQSLWEGARRLFHTIKGTAATFHLDAVSVPAKAGEARCIVAIEEPKTRTSEAFDVCIQRAQAVASALHLAFDEQPLRLALAEKAEQLRVAALVPAQPAVDPEMAGFFIRDANDQIAAIEQAVLAWEKGENPGEQVWAAQRGFHTLKGAANSIGLTAVASSVHEAEAHLENVAATNAAGTRPLFVFLFTAVDQLRDYLRRLTANTAALWHHDWKQNLQALAQPDAASETAEKVVTSIATVAVAPTMAKLDAPDEDSQTLRIEAAQLYKLINLVGELVIDRKRVEIKIEQLANLHRSLNERNGSLNELVQNFQQQFEFNVQGGNRAAGSLPRGRGLNLSPESNLPGNSTSEEFSDLEFDRYDQFNVLARSLVEISHDVEQLNEEMADCLHAFESENAQFQQTSDQLQHQVTNLSMVPVSSVFPRLKRVFRDALQVEEKDADLIVDGGDALLDKVVMDKIYSPLMHLLRNAVGHGIEDAATREQLKKPARGTVRLSTAQASNQIVITLSDDGAGIKSDAVRQRAVEKGWLATDAPALTNQQVVDFIFRPGFSTAVKVTSISGRGVGLDVVRQEIENLNGSVELKFEADQGCTWTLRLPLTLSISEAILTQVGDSTFAFPINYIEAGIILENSTTRDEHGRETYLVGETALPLVRLSEVLQMPGNTNATNGVILSIGDRRAIVVVDRVLARQEIVNKQLDSLSARHPLLNGATLDVDGRVIPILNLPALLKFSERDRAAGTASAHPAGEASGHSELSVLIVDDSLSVRKVQERFLRDLGCRVTAATDGLHALEKLRKGKFDVVFTDLEMPRLNGYELITELRGNPAWAGMPIVVISSRGADKYITKAMNHGATTFLCKPFTAEQLEQVLRHYGNWDSVARMRLEAAMPA